ncbi:hypothetical protein CORC01_13615 [Colletotrichum orchidophilum]|uniref:Uncharacterized protein n=1 Tax=Colletotrichum orchidophilum TaxID=1209926 RepID=A0A1G4APQ6_9PEZI|nr:uncharacterized protein CORC01_13615 [Colletotrichum orchidophilum]OHE91096.1 hypothetical protein CORC01_13615 [Colletotrichum orchidophilum]
MKRKDRLPTAVIHGPIQRSPTVRLRSNEVLVFSGSPPPRFEKRARYKTREDRYDSRKKPKEKRQRTREETTTRPENSPKKTTSSGREGPNNFQSEAILNNRLTNGRISSPKPVEELAYNSMISVEQPPSRKSSWQRQQRLEAKGRQRRESEFVGISAFLRRKETPTATHSDQGLGLHRARYEDRELSDRLPEKLLVCEDHFSRRSITRSDSISDGQRQHIHDETYVAPARHIRSSSRSTTYVTQNTSGNHQISLPGDILGRHHSSTPELMREALRETGVFDGARKGGNARVSSHDSRQRRQGLHLEEEEKHKTAKAFREQPRIILYSDKGVMTTHEPSLSPRVLENSTNLADAQDTFEPERKRRLRAGGSVDSTTQKATDEPSGGRIHNDSDTESRSKTTTLTTRAATAAQACLAPHPNELSTEMEVTPGNTQEVRKMILMTDEASMVMTEKDGIRVADGPEPERVATVEQHDKNAKEKLLVTIFMIIHTASITDFIARIEQEVLGIGSSGCEDKPFDEPGIQQHDDRLQLPFDMARGPYRPVSQDVLIDQSFTKADWRHPEDAFDPLAEQPSEIEFYGERPNYENDYRQQQKVTQLDQDEEDEKDEMRAFWRPNYFC